MSNYPKSYPEPKHPHWQSLIGEKFGKLEVISYGGKELRGSQINHNWNCECECKNIVTIEQLDLKKSRKTSCGKGSCIVRSNKPSPCPERDYIYYGDEPQSERTQSESEKRYWRRLKRQPSAARQKERESSRREFRRELKQLVARLGSLTPTEIEHFQNMAEGLGLSFDKELKKLQQR